MKVKLDWEWFSSLRNKDFDNQFILSSIKENSGLVIPSLLHAEQRMSMIRDFLQLPILAEDSIFHLTVDIANRIPKGSVSSSIWGLP
jgi:hypothetical protein